jgi:hypothetical protein
MLFWSIFANVFFLIAIVGLSSCVITLLKERSK